MTAPHTMTEIGIPDLATSDYAVAQAVNFLVTNRIANTSISPARRWIALNTFNALFDRGTHEYGDIWKSLAEK